MLAVQAARTGGPEVLEVVDLPIPEPGPAEVLIRQEAVGLNFIDTYYRTGLYPGPMPAVLGVEAAGVIEAVGEEVTGLAPGQRVAYAGGRLGAYAQYRTHKADRVVAIPEGVSTRLAAAALLKGMTAEFLLRRCYTVRPGQAILVHAAAGGVGQILVQWGNALGARVIGTAGDPAKAAAAKGLGCDEVILYREEDVAARVRAFTGGEGVAVVYDGVGAATFEASLDSLARRGMLVNFGNASGLAPAVAPARLAQGGSLFLTRPGLFDYIATAEELRESAAALFEVLGSGAVKVEVGQEFPLAEARAAHEALEGRRTTGSTLLIP